MIGIQQNLQFIDQQIYKFAQSALSKQFLQCTTRARRAQTVVMKRYVDIHVGACC